MSGNRVGAMYALRMAREDIERLKSAASASGRKASKIARDGIRRAASEALSASPEKISDREH